MKYEDFRREYTAGGLVLDELHGDPMQQFQLWMTQVVEAELIDPTAMVLGTVNRQGQPWQRIVLCKGVDKAGFTFFTNHDSDKARAIEANADVSLLFPWNALDRQVIVAGTASRLGQREAEAYFASRPRDSQVAAWASRQSRPLDSRDTLEAQVEAASQRFSDDAVPLPPFWGGYRVTPHQMEFWQGRENRLHDRFRYRRVSGERWEIVQLQP